MCCEKKFSGPRKNPAPPAYLIVAPLPTLSMAICILSTCSLDIGTTRKQFTFCASSIHIECTVWLLSIVTINMQYGCCHTLQSSPWCHQCSFGSLCNFTPYPFCARKEVFERFCNDNYIREKKKQQDNDPKQDRWHQGLLEECGGMAATVLHSATYCHTTHSICILQYTYCLRIVPISKPRVHIARSSHTECNSYRQQLSTLHGALRTVLLELGFATGGGAKFVFLHEGGGRWLSVSMNVVTASHCMLIGCSHEIPAPDCVCCDDWKSSWKWQWWLAVSTSVASTWTELWWLELSHHGNDNDHWRPVSRESLSSATSKSFHTAHPSFRRRLKIAAGEIP